MNWTQCYTSLASPSVSLPRFGHSAVCVDGTTNWGSDLIVVYGGVGQAAGESAQTALGDVVVLQVDSGTWSVPAILPGSSPGARAFHSAVAVGSRVLVFGGHILSYDAGQNRKKRTFFNDVWQLDTDDWKWSKLQIDATSPTPAGRDMATLLLMDDNTLLLFGGRSESGKGLQDAWLFDIAKCTWQAVKPDGPSPPARKMHSMVKLDHQAVLFGGERDNGPLDDLWVLRGWQPGATPRWTQIKMKVSPAPRFGHTLAVVRSPQPTVPTTSDAAAAAILTEQTEPQQDITAAATDSAAADAAAAATTATTPTSTAATTPTSSSGGGAAAAVASDNPCIVMFGGCLDLSSFLSLNRNYVQSKEAWLLDMKSLTWVQVSSTDAAGVGPSERMCHSMTLLSDGRLLLLGGRHKDGICKDLWWLQVSVPPAVLPTPSAAAAAASSQQQSTGGAVTPPRPSSQQSLLQSLLGPIRHSRESSQSQITQQPAAAATFTTSTAAVASGSSTPSRMPSLPTTPTTQQQQQQQDVLKLRDTPAAPAATAATAATVYTAPVIQQQQQQASQSPAAATAAAESPLPPPHPATPVAAAAAAGQAGSSSSSNISQQQQPLTALMNMDVALGSGELAKLIRNPAAYSADAINKLSSSVTSTVSSLLAAREGQTGTLAGALPAALSRVAPGLLQQQHATAAATRSDSSSTVSPAVAALRAQLGLPASTLQQQQGTAAAAVVGPCMPAAAVLQELVTLGQQLLGDENNGTSSSSSSSSRNVDNSAVGGSSSSSFTTSSSIPPDVLVSAARQHLMLSAVAQLHVAHVALLLADYQHLAAVHYEQQLLSKLSEGFTAAAQHATSCSSIFLQRQPHELLLNQVPQLQAEYKQLIMDYE